MTCGVGTGQRTCSEDWADDRCTSCILTQTYDCPADLSACESLDVSVANCVAACDGDARCMNRECAEVMCHLAQCLDKRCPDVGERCF